jgi:hypothetical protein
VYVTKSLKKDEYKHMPDQLKTGELWVGNTTYDNYFAEPNPEYFAKKVKLIEKKDPTITGDKLQFRKFTLTQAPHTRAISSGRQASSVRPRSTSRPTGRAPSPKAKITSQKTVTSKQFLNTFTQFRPPNTSTSEQLRVMDVLY